MNSHAFILCYNYQVKKLYFISYIILFTRYYNIYDIYTYKYKIYEYVIT
jgi:hypothetical protein